MYRKLMILTAVLIFTLRIGAWVEVIIDPKTGEPLNISVTKEIPKNNSYDSNSASDTGDTQPDKKDDADSSNGSGTTNNGSEDGSNSSSDSDSASGTGNIHSDYEKTQSDPNFGQDDKVSGTEKEKTTSLNLSNTGLSDLSGIKNLRNLKSLNLSGNNISNSSGTDFSVLNKLEELNLEDNQIETLKGLGLENLVNLKRLYLSGNPLKVLDPEVISKLKNLKFLGFSDGEFNYLDIIYVFIPDKNLKTCVWEEIEKFSEYSSTADKITFEDVERIIELNAKGRGIEDLRGIEHFKNIKKLDLEENMIKSLYKIDFSKLNSLELLNLAGNSIKSLEGFDEALPDPKNHLDIYLQKNEYSNPIVSLPDFYDMVKKIEDKFNSKIEIII